jgi:acyl-CoA dehydrogenase
VATAYERRHGALSRPHQFALAYLFTPSTDIYSCPLAMTDGAARALLASGNQALIERAVPHLTSRDPARFWTSGQWMTETPGGSDVRRTETRAVPAGPTGPGNAGHDAPYRLWGRKWFTSATTSQMALTLARPETDGGLSDVALFYVETRGEDGRLAGIRIDRLKDKLGTRKVPTAELHLEGVPAWPVAGLTHGVRHIAPMLNVTRVWNAVSAVALMRRGIALARDYAHRREAFGSPLADKPLHRDTLAGLQAEFEGAFHLTFRCVELLGRVETGAASLEEEALLRLLTPIAKLTTAKQAVAVCSEVLECFGGAGYVEDTGLPVLLRDAQVLPIWEGTTNVLSLDLLRGLAGRSGDAGDAFGLLREEIERALGGDDGPASARARQALSSAGRRLAAAARDQEAAEAGARGFALTVGRTLELALSLEQARWSRDHEGDERPAAAARRLAAHGVDRLLDETLASRDDARALALDEAQTPALIPTGEDPP